MENHLKELVANRISNFQGHFKSPKYKVLDQPDVKEPSINYMRYLYWTTIFHKSSYKHQFIAGSTKYITKNLSCLLTKLLNTIKDGLVRYCNTKTQHSGVNNMWILPRSFNQCYRYTDHLADYLDLTFIIDSQGKLSTRLYDRSDDFEFHIVNFPFFFSNILSGLCTAAKVILKQK